MVLKLYGTGGTTCTRRVAALLHEKKIPFELVEINFAISEHRAPWFLANQPFGQVPYIDDDGFILYESRAICRYLAEKHSTGPKLIPDGLKERALFEQAASVEQSNFDPFASKAVAETVFKPLHGGTPDQAVYQALIKSLGAKLDVYEAILSKQKYMAGSEFTLVDIFHLPYGDMLAQAGSNMMSDESRPNVVRWWKDITTRESWVAVKDGVIKPIA